MGNYGAALMAHRIPSVEEPQEPDTHTSRFSLQSAEEEEESND